jgi:hypothetical protein
MTPRALIRNAHHRCITMKGGIHHGRKKYRLPEEVGRKGCAATGVEDGMLDGNCL